MEISKLRRMNEPPSKKGFQVVATFNLDVSDDLRIFDFQMVKAPDGRCLVYAPRTKRSDMLAMSPAMRNAIVTLVTHELGELNGEAENGTNGRIAA